MDFIPSIALKYWPEAIILEILALFNHILNNNYFPKAWKTAEVTPILKRNKPPDQLSSKTISRIASDIIYHLNSNNPSPLGVVLIDLTRAFDKVWLPSLMYKIQQAGCDQRVCHSLWEIKSERKFIVSANQIHSSSTFSFHSGSQQGTILAPTLFNIYIYNPITQELIPKQLILPNHFLRGLPDNLFRCKQYQNDINKPAQRHRHHYQSLQGLKNKH